MSYGEPTSAVQAEPDGRVSPSERLSLALIERGVTGRQQGTIVVIV